MKPIVAKDEGKAFTPHPAGQYRFVCADIHDEGTRPGPFGAKHQVRIVFVSELLNEQDPERRPFEHSQWFTLSLNEKSNLRKFLEQWRGIAFTEEQIQEGWDITKVVGANAYVQILHKKKEAGGIKPVIASIMKLPKGMKGMEIPKDFKTIEQRLKERDAEQQGQPQGAPAPDDNDYDNGDDDLPF